MASAVGTNKGADSSAVAGRPLTDSRYGGEMPSTSTTPAPTTKSKRTGRLTEEDDFFMDVADLNKVHEELEKLNIATDVINKLELQLDEARAVFREIQSSWSQRLDHLIKKLGGCIEKSRPYYEARLYVRQIQDEAQKAAIRFERANTMHAVAKQQVNLTQDSLNRQNPTKVDPACLEVLNHHIQRVNEAETERLRSIEDHRRVSRAVLDANTRVSQMEKDVGRHIKKSRPYFDARVEFTKVLENQKSLIQKLEVEIKQKKRDYTTSLRNLEKISEKIHEERQVKGIKREAGVGCEAPVPGVSFVEQSYTASHNDVCEKSTEGEMELVTSTDAVIRQELIEMNPSDLPKRPNALGNGVILLAQRLGFAVPSPQETDSQQKQQTEYNNRLQHLDLQYRTVPEGVTPLSPTADVVGEDGADDRSSVTSSSTGATGGGSSLASSRTIDEKLDGFLSNHLQLIQEIDESATRAKRMAHQLDAASVDSSSSSSVAAVSFGGIGHRRSVSGDLLPERGSASGESCS